MKRSLAQVRAHESAARSWLAGFDPDDGKGVIGPDLDRYDQFGLDVVLAAFEAGHEHADQEHAIERSTGQRQLDDADALMREASDLFVAYGEHHKARAEEHVAAGRLEDALASLGKAKRNLVMAVRLKAWLAGEGVYPTGVNPAEVLRGCAEQLAADLGTGVLHDQFDEAARHLEEGVPVLIERGNVRPITSGPLADPLVVEGLMAAAGMADATCPLSLAKATAFRLQTGDPRFDPTRPVCVNGFLFQPATEDLWQTN